MLAEYHSMLTMGGSGDRVLNDYMQIQVNPLLQSDTLPLRMKKTKEHKP